MNKTSEAKVQPTLTKILPNVKTLEEIEAELLNNSSANTSLAESTKSKGNQDSELLRKFPQLAAAASPTASDENSSPQKNAATKSNGDLSSYVNNKASQLFATNLELNDGNRKNFYNNNNMGPLPQQPGVHMSNLLESSKNV